MSSPPPAREVLALVSRLRELALDFKSREERLNADLRARLAAETRAYETAKERQAAAAAEAIEQIETEYQRGKERIQARFEQRKKRINQAHITSRTRAMDAIRAQEARSKYKLQQGTLNAERRRDAERAAAAERLAQFNEQLVQSQESFRQIEQRASRSFRGYGAWRRSLLEQRDTAVDLSPDETTLFARIQELHQDVETQLRQFRKFNVASIARHFPFWLAALLLAAGAALLTPQARELASGIPWKETAIGLIVAGILLAALRVAGSQRARAAALPLADTLSRIRRMYDACFDKAQRRHDDDQQRILAEYEAARRQLDQEWKQAVKESINLLDQRPKQIDEQAQRAAQRLERLHRQQLERIEREYPAAQARVRNENETAAREVEETHARNVAQIRSEAQARSDALVAEWTAQVEPICRTLNDAGTAARELFPEWTPEFLRRWTPPAEFHNAAQFGRLEIDFARLAELSSPETRLTLPCSDRFTAPLALGYPNDGSILFETSGPRADEALAAINNIIFRLLSVTPPGKIAFTIFDPVGLGQNFAGLMHLADYEESHINSRIWTQTGQLEEKLAELNEHMEKVIQMYLRNEYATIAEYNARAGAIAEKYHVLVIADFPANFSDTALRRLINIATSGARCGVYTLIHWDRRQALPAGFVPDDLRKNSLCLVQKENGSWSAAGQPRGTRLLLEMPPPPDLVTEFLREIGKHGKDTQRVEVPFSHVAPPPEKIWSEETTDELRVPIGRSGATRLQYLAIGKGTRQHALIAGKTGSGKSTLFHVIITNLALWCRPEEVEFYLVDFKKGVEFKCYATRRLPHARVVAIESDRQFGLSVLQRVDEELRRRGDLFRRLGVQDLAGYRRAGGTEPLPRSLLMIDEFQEFFTEEDRVSQGAAVLLDRIVRQGRAFGIHVILGSQTLGGAYTLARATLGQMVIRIALQCNEADAYLIMDQDNPAPRLLSRPGEGIYNDAAGSLEGNSPFQAVWLPEDARDEYLAQVREHADRSNKSYPGPFVFEGNAPADVRDNVELRDALQTEPTVVPSRPRIWLGAPNSVKGHTEASFQRQSGSNLLIVGQSEEPALSLVSVALVSLAAAYPAVAARFIVLDSTPPGLPQREFLDRLIRALPHEVISVKPGDVPEQMNALGADLKARSGDEPAADGPETFVLIHGLQNYKKLKQEDDFSFSDTSTETPAGTLLSLINEGPVHGFHVIATCDTYNNVARYLGRKVLSEFEMRVLFQMSASDSASLIDDPGASTLGLHRALFYNDREGYQELFRPYALPDSAWVEEVARCLGRRTRQTAPQGPQPSSGITH